MLDRNLIQIAGVIDQVEADMLQLCGVKCLGFPLRLPINRDDIGEDDAATIIRSLPLPTFGVLITYLDDAADIAEFCAFLGAPVAQLHGAIEIDEIAKLKTIAPKLLVIKSLVVGLHSEATLASMVEQFSSFVDAFITDTYDPASGASGATGITHDWAISRRLVELSSRPVILAGGLDAENVRRAILEVKPAGVDTHSGVEDDDGRKCRDKVERFMAEARIGFRILDNAAYG